MLGNFLNIDFVRSLLLKTLKFCLFLMREWYDLSGQPPNYFVTGLDSTLLHTCKSVSCILKSRQKYFSNYVTAVEYSTFCLPGNLNLARRRASMMLAMCWSRPLTDMMGWPMCTRATVPWALPNAPRIPVWSLQQNKHKWMWISFLVSIAQGFQWQSMHFVLKTWRLNEIANWLPCR